MEELPREGRTKLAHAAVLLARAEAAIIDARRAVDYNEIRRKPARREQLSRELAGVVGAVESVRMWLDAGAPE